MPLALAAAVLLFVLVPPLLSSGPVLHFVVGILDRQLPGSLTVESWLVSWRQGILCQQVAYLDPGRGIRLRIPQVTTSQGLLSLVFAPADLGQVIVSAPELDLDGGAWTDGSTAGTGSGPPALIPFWNHLATNLEIREGKIGLTMVDPALVTGLRDLSLSATFAGGIVTFTAGVRTLNDQGLAKLEGTLNLPPGGEGGLDTLVADGKFTANGLQLRDLLTVAGRRFPSLPAGEGVLNAALEVKGASLARMQGSGWAELVDLRLRGGVLGEDVPAWQRLRLDIEGGAWSALGWQVREFTLASDTAEAQGAIEFNDKDLRLAGKGRLNLPVLFAQFPRLLRLREETRLESGAADFSLTVQRSRDEQHLDLSFKAEPLIGLAAGKNFAWSGPVSLLLNGEQNGKEWRLHAFQIDAPFLHADGRGERRSFILDASADLGQAMVEVGRLFQLEWSGAGRLDLSLMGTEEKNGEERLRAAMDLQVNGLALNHGGTAIVPSGDFSILGSISSPQGKDAGAEQAVDLELAVSSWLGETFVTMNGVQGEGRPFRAHYSTDTNLSLERASGLLHTLKVLPAASSAAGDVQIQAAGYVSGAELEIREFAGEINNLVLAREGATFTEKEVRLEISPVISEPSTAFTTHPLIVARNRGEFFRTGAGSPAGTPAANPFTVSGLIVARNRGEFFRTGAGGTVIDFEGPGLFFRNASLSAATGSVKLTELLLPDRHRPLAGLHAELAGTFDLERVSELLRGAALVKGQTDLAGAGQLSLRAMPAGEGGQEVAAELNVADVALVQGKKRTPVSRELRLGGQMARQSAAGEFAIKDVHLHADPLQVEGSGAILGDDGWRKIEVQGRLTPVLEKVSAVIREGLGIDLRMAGGQGESFLLQIPLAGGGNGGTTGPSLVTSLHADRVDYRGLALRSLHLPLSLENRGLHLEATGQLDEEGKLVLIADADLAASPPTLAVPANSQILTSVLVQQPLQENFLLYLHPFFGVLAKPAGRIDLRLDSFSWPLGKKGRSKAEFVTVTDLRELTVESGAVLQEILSLFALDKEPLLLMASELACTARQGRVSCEKLRVRISDAEMLVSGTWGLDGSLDVLLEVPLTRKLLNEEGFRYLEGETVLVPVKGTVKAPAFDRDKTRAEVRDLLHQAAASLAEEKKKHLTPGGKVIPQVDRRD